MPNFFVTPVSVDNSASLNFISASSYARLDIPNTFTSSVTISGSAFVNGNVVYNQSITSVSSVFYTLLRTDSGVFVDMTSSAVNTVYVPASANVSWAVGTRIDIIQSGAGQTNIVPANAAITINYYSPSASAARTIKGRYGAATLVYKSAENWLLIGNLS